MSRSLKKPKQGSLALALAIAAGLIFAAFTVVYLVNVVKDTTISRPKELDYAELYSHFSGKDKSSKTLVLFANNAEQRFGGGFLGSYAVLEGKAGKFKMSDVANIYNIDYDHLNAKLAIPVPEYMKFLAPYLGLRDSGLYHDWPRNAQSAIDFYKADTGEDVDNVIQITPQVLKELLKDTGPVELKDYNLTVTDANFLETVQLEVEAGRDKIAGKDPKSGILTGLAQVLMQRLVNLDFRSLQKYNGIFDNLVNEKAILLYSKDKNTQGIIEELDMAGSIKKTDYNYFQIAEANFGADKSTPFIKQNVIYDQTITPEGKSIVKITIKRQHTSDFKNQYINPYTNKSDWLVKKNISYMQVLVPAETKLISSEGITDLKKSSERFVNQFSYVSVLNPLGSSEVSLSYEIPQHYSLGSSLNVNTFVQKQNGGWPYQIEYILRVPNNYHLRASNKKNLVSTDGSTTILRDTINIDTILSLIYEKTQ